MAIDMTLPELGEGIESGDIVEVLVAVGDTIEVDEAVMEIETDKATIEVPATVAGVVASINVSAGETAAVGQVLLTVESAGEAPVAEAPAAAEAAPEEAAPAAPVAPEPVEEEVVAESGMLDVILPELGEGIESGSVVDVLVAVGDSVELDDSVLEVETDKATVEVPTDVAGVVKEIRVSAGDTANVGQVLLVIEGSKAAPKKTGAAPAAAPASTPAPAAAPAAPAAPAAAPAPAARNVSTKGNRKPVAASPTVRRLAFEIGVDVYEVAGTGPGGRISRDDVKRHAKRLLTDLREGRIGGGPVTPPLPDFSQFGEIDIETMSNIRRKTSEHMSNCWNTIPHVTQFDKADITDLEAFRQEKKAAVEAAGGKLTTTAMLVKVLATALKEFPNFNASVDGANNEIILKKYINIGIAVDTPRGLLVPVIRDVDQKSVVDICKEIGVIAGKARDRKVSLEDLSGGTFTVTNLGGISGTAFTPIVNWPEVAILGVSRSTYEPVYDKASGAFVPRFMMPLCLSYDHRLIDGADAARFVKFIADQLAGPMPLGLDD